MDIQTSQFPHFFPTIIARDHVREPLYAVVPYFNPWQWKSRVKHTERALKHFHDSGATIIFVEIAFNRRDFEFTGYGIDGTPSNCGILGSDTKFRHVHVQLRTKDELWLKENAINIGAQRIPNYDWQNICWLDSDVHFLRPNWVSGTIQKLQHGTQSDIAFLQMFSHARDLGPNYEMLSEDYPHANGIGFVEAWQKGYIQTTESPEIKQDLKELKVKRLSDPPKFPNDPRLRPPNPEPVMCEDGHYYGKLLGTDKRVFPGLAWACTRKAWDAVGGQLDVAVWGGGDWHMSHALIEKTEGMMRNDLHKNYQKIVNQWYQRCRTHVRRNVLVLDGSITHHWHGKKTGRGYNAKHSLLATFGFDPPRHLKRDSQGLWQLHDDRSTSYVKIRDMMRVVARERNEDSIDI